MPSESVPASEFESLVEEALETLPPEFLSMLDNVAIVVEEEPDPEDLEHTGIPSEHELLGIFRGVARTQGGWNHLPALPNQISIFRGPILRIARTRRQVIRQVRETVIHELGHFFGLGDHQMPY
ncbi:MAG TPA: metallopeptidase family protein [Thermoanaerobaculia bacterium]|nr:metallopeptidase family protein [Thermoanaerobaculia bacterium]